MTCTFVAVLHVVLVVQVGNECCRREGTVWVDHEHCRREETPRPRWFYRTFRHRVGFIDQLLLRSTASIT